MRHLIATLRHHLPAATLTTTALGVTARVPRLGVTLAVRVHPRPWVGVRVQGEVVTLEGLAQLAEGDPHLGPVLTAALEVWLEALRYRRATAETLDVVPGWGEIP